MVRWITGFTAVVNSCLQNIFSNFIQNFSKSSIINYTIKFDITETSTCGVWLYPIYASTEINQEQLMANLQQLTTEYLHQISQI
jgi:hypothetical protein